MSQVCGKIIALSRIINCLISRHAYRPGSALLFVIVLCLIRVGTVQMRFAVLVALGCNTNTESLPAVVSRLNYGYNASNSLETVRIFQCMICDY